MAIRACYLERGLVRAENRPLLRINSGLSSSSGLGAAECKEPATPLSNAGKDMPSSVIRSYFAGEASIDDLRREAMNRVRIDGDSMIASDLKGDSSAARLTCRTLSRLCRDWRSGRVTAEDLPQIAFWIVASEEMEWDSDTPDGAVVAETLSNWSSPEVDFRLTDRSMACFEARLNKCDLSVKIEE